MSVRVFTVPYDSGRRRERMGCGPDWLFELGIKPLLTQRKQAWEWEEIAVSDPHPAEISTAFSLCRKVSERVREVRGQGEFPLVLSGNCNAALGTISACGCEDTGVLWFDAHGEANTPETTRSGFLDGMGLAVLTGHCWRVLAASIPGFAPLPGERVLLADARDVEPEENSLLNRAGVIRAATAAALQLAIPSWARNSAGVYVHDDLDVLDPKEAVSNQWAPPGGMALAELLGILTELRRHTTIRALGIASYDPTVDSDGRALRAATAIVEAVLQA